MWDIGGDGFDSMDIGNVELLEIAELSLDELGLEAVLIDLEINASI